MYMSRVWLDTHKEETAKAMASPARFHGATERAFSGDRQHPQWRIDRVHGEYCILMVSHDKPDLTSMQKQFGKEYLFPETKSYDPMIDQVAKGQTWRFKIAVNPMRRNRGKNHAICGEHNRMNWMIEQGIKNGFAIVEDQFMITGEKDHEFKKYTSDDPEKYHMVTFHETDFEGVLCITDAELFKNALCHGIGREKAYGVGMLTIV